MPPAGTLTDLVLERSVRQGTPLSARLRDFPCWTRRRFAEDFFLYHIKPIERLAVRLDKVNHHTAITRPQDTGRNFDHSREVGRITNRSDTFWTVPHLRPEVLRSLEGIRQALKSLRDTFVSEALPVHRAVEVVTCVNVPAAIPPTPTRNRSDRWPPSPAPAH